LTEETAFFARYPNEVQDRLDENYNNPRYDEIEVLLSRAQFDVIQLGKSQERLDKRFLLNIASGKTPKNVRYEDEGIPFVGATSVRDERVNLEIAPRISREIHETTLRGSQTKRDDILITMAGFYIGRCAVYEHDDECNANQAIAILRVNKDNVVPKFLVKYFNSRLGQLFFGKLQHIAGQPNINLDEIVQIKVILPSRPEQERILNSVSKIEAEALPIETEIESLRRQANSMLLEELKIPLTKDEASKYFFKAGKGETSYFVVPFEQSIDRMSYHFHDPKQLAIRDLTDRYPTTCLGSIAITPIRRGEQPIYSETGTILCIKTVDVKEGYIDYDNCLKTTEESYRNFPTAHVQKGDVLVSSTGYGSIGKVAVYDRDEPAMVDNHVSIVRLTDGYDPYFVTYFLLSYLGKLQFEKWWTGSSGQIELQPTDLEKFIIPDNTEGGVPHREQERVVSRISQALSDIARLEDKSDEILQKSRAEFARLVGISTQGSVTSASDLGGCYFSSDANGGT